MPIIKSDIKPDSSKFVLNNVRDNDISIAETLPPTVAIILLLLKVGLTLFLKKRKVLKREIMQKIYLDAVGKDKQNNSRIGESENTPKPAPSIMGSRRIIDFFICKKKLATASKISSKTPQITAAVPPLKPGIIAPAPINAPFAILIKNDLKFIIQSPPSKC